MRYRLEEDHYDNDAMTLLPAGTEVGDGCANPWRYPASVPAPNAGLSGKPRPPSRSMTPLDDEAKREWRAHFEGDVPDRDPTKAIPITPADGKRDAQGNVKPDRQPSPPGQPNPAPAVPNEPAHTGVNPMKDQSVAKEDPLGNRTPEQHKPGEDKPLPGAASPKPTKG